VEVGIDGHMQVDDLELRSVVGLMMPEGGQSAKQLEQVTQRMGHLQIKDRILTLSQNCVKLLFMRYNWPAGSLLLG
jgi:hypothetical protein